MNQMKNLSKKMAKSLISATIDPETREWPPKCSVLIYQPLRPVAKRTDKNSDENKRK